MKRNLFTFLSVVVLLIGLAAVAYAIHEEKPSETMVTLPGPDAAKLYDYIAKDNPYVKWELWPGKGRLYKGREPHGSLLTTYVNNNAYFSAKDRKGEMAASSIIVKENYTSEKKLAALTVMYKIKGYNPAAGDWFWAKYEPYGNVLASGKVEACINCHGGNRANDFIMTEKIGK
jgi:hypothetical protein